MSEISVKDFVMSDYSLTLVLQIQTSKNHQ